MRSHLLFREQYVAISAPQWRPSVAGSDALSTAQLRSAALAVAVPTATFHDSVEQMLVRMKLDHRIVLRARHFGSLPELALSTDLLAVVPEMYARQASARWGLRTWRLPQAPHYEVRLVWHASTDADPAHQWFRAKVQQLFGREGDDASVQAA